MRLKLSINNRKHKGVVLVYVAIIILVLILLVGLALDTARVYLVAHQLQNAADAASLAGAQIVGINQSGARLQARDIGNLNYAQGNPVILNLNTNNADLNGDIVIGRYYPSIKSFVPTVPTDSNGYPKPNAVRVEARRTKTAHGPIPLIFGPIANVNTANVDANAIAVRVGGLGAGLIVLSEESYPHQGRPAALTFNGGPEVYVVNGSIQVNNPNQNPIDKGGVGNNVIVHADEFNTVSNTDSTDGYIFDSVTGLRVTTEQPKIPDPYASVDAPYPNSDQLPDHSSVETKITGSTEATFQPGYYSQGFKITGGNATFKPGVYVVGGGGLEITGGTVWAERVMFYIIDSGNVSVNGGSGATLIKITEINTDDPGKDHLGNLITYTQDISYLKPYNGMTIFQSRTNTNQADIVGGNGLDINGTIYFPYNNVKLTGGSGSFGIQVIAYTIDIGSSGGGQGATRLFINYDGRNRTPASRSYLVK